MNYIIIIIIGAAFTCCSAQAKDLNPLLKQAQKITVEILKQTPPEKVDYTKFPEEQFRGRIKAFYSNTKNYSDLIDEAKNAPIELVDVNDNGACAQTKQMRLAVIYISKTACKREILSLGDAARLLIGEYVHHLGKGDEFTDWVKLTIIENWRVVAPKDYNEVFSVSFIAEIESEFDITQLYGSGFLTPDVLNPELFAINSRGHISFDHSNHLGKKVDLGKITTRPFSFNKEEQRFETTGEWIISGHESVEHYTGLRERYPAFIRDQFKIFLKVYDKGEMVKLSYQQPTKFVLNADLDEDEHIVEKEMIDKVYLLRPGKEVLDAFIKKRRSQ